MLSKHSGLILWKHNACREDISWPASPAHPASLWQPKPFPFWLGKK